MQKYTKTLVTQEMGLGNLIENAVKQLQVDRERELAENDADADIDDEEDYDEYVFNHDAKEDLITTEDYQKYLDAEDETLTDD